MKTTKLKQKKTSPSFAGIWLILLLALSLSACAHVTPVTNDPTQAGFDGNEQNSGIVREVTTIGPDGDKQSQGWEITPGARDRYNAFVERFGSRLMPPIRKDFGMSPMLNSSGNYLMTKEAESKWYQMILLSRRDRVNKSDTILHKIGVE